MSFDYDRDRLAARGFIGQANRRASPFHVSNWMLKEAAPEREWLRKAIHQIKQSHVIVVLCGDQTYRAPGVLKEVKAARLLQKPIVQIRARSGARVRPVLQGEPLFDRNWATLRRVLPTRPATAPVRLKVRRVRPD